MLLRESRPGQGGLPRILRKKLIFKMKIRFTLQQQHLYELYLLNKMIINLRLKPS